MAFKKLVFLRHFRTVTVKLLRSFPQIFDYFLAYILAFDVYFCFYRTSGAFSFFFPTIQPVENASKNRKARGKNNGKPLNAALTKSACTASALFKHETAAISLYTQSKF